VNERLRRALAEAYITRDALAEATNVDPKTVQHWLKGRVPHARHRWKVAELLKVHEDVLWPMDSNITISEPGKTDLDTIRRLLVQGTLGLAVSTVFPGQTLPVVAQPMLTTAINEEFLSKSDTTIKYCWESYYSGGAFLVEQFLPTFLAELVPLAQQSSKYQKRLAGITSQAYQLSCEQATDQENFGTALDFGQNAILYAKHAEDAHLQVSALIRLANLYFHRKQSTYALRAYQQALPLLDSVSPLLQGRVYAGLAEVFAMRNQQQEALLYIGLAHECYPAQPEHDPAYYYTHISRYSLYVFGEGQTRLSLNQPKEAWENFTHVEKHLLGSETELLSRVDLLYYQAEASVMLGVLETSCAHIQTAGTLAKSASSRLYYNKILGTYQEVRRKWQHERQVIELEELFQPW
jgi:tetratricopeptide (TPR) repeat protein